jgi:carbohydrate kinase (thermoresistant glucokinase family)
MAAGQPLDDVDRSPWLHLVGQRMKTAESDEMRTVVACSALKRTYRDILREYVPDVFFVFLDGSLAQIRERIATRKSGVPASLLTSQFATLKGLQDDELGIRVDISFSPQEIIDQIVEKLGA